MEIERQASEMEDLPDSIPTNAREWLSFIEQYEALSNETTESVRARFPYKKSVFEVAEHAYGLIYPNTDWSFVGTPQLSQDGRLTHGVIHSQIHLEVQPNKYGKWFESHGVDLKKLYFDYMANKIVQQGQQDCATRILGYGQIVHVNNHFIRRETSS
jgi:hypothetical protein